MKSRVTRRSILLFVFLCFIGGVFVLYAQEMPAGEEPPPDEQAVETSEQAVETSNQAVETSERAVEINVLTPEQKRIDMDIKTSRLTELAAWCRSLGLSEGGTSAELARRLRDYFKITETIPAGEDKRKIITIESARTTEYFKLEAVDEDYARLNGEVVITLKDGDAVHRIKAWNILFNRTRNILTASGGVEYIKEDGDKIETFRGDSITVNIDNWSSIFLGGVSERSLQGDGAKYLFSGTVISRNDEEVTTLNKATISNAVNEEALWSLNASRVWLLPGSDFAIFNAVLNVGEIPVLYIPFFYYPADEVIFHPVIGFRTREGNFVQTTTYLIGRPKASGNTQSSLTKILGNSNDMEKKREGLFLRSTGKKAVDPNAVSLRALFDYYANLGAYGGLDFTSPKFGILGSTSINLGIGLTRTIAHPSSGEYTPYYPNYDGESDWNSSNLFSMEVPFRYRFEMSSSISGKYGSLSWSLPYHSDPWVDSDFTTNRAEEMDWVNMIQKGAAVEAEESTTSEKGSYSWQLTGNLNPHFPNMSPWITGISVSGITSTVSFATKDISSSLPSNDIGRYSPSRKFYIPDTATLYSISGSIAGKPLALGGAAPARTNANPDAKPEAPEDRLQGIGVPRSPWEETATETGQKKDSADKLVPPVLNQRFEMPRVGTTSFSLDYRFAPNSASQLQFRTQKWQSYDEIDWADVSSVLVSTGGDAGITLNMNQSSGLFTSTFAYTGNGTWRQYGYLNEEAEEYTTTTTSGIPDPVKIDAAKKAQYQQSNFSTSYNLTNSLRPLYWNSIFGASSIQYTLSGLAVRSKFAETGTGTDPEWELEYGEWTNERITSHQLSTSIAASIMDKTQNLTLSSELPPKDSAISGTAAIRVWISETNASMRVLFPDEEDKRKFLPFNATEILRFGTYGSLTHYMVLDTELKEFTTITTTLNLSKWGFNTVYSAIRMKGYEFIVPPSGIGGRWEEKKDDEPSLQSNYWNLSYAKTFSQKDLWNKRLNFSINLNTLLYFDLQRFTSSYFNFSLGFTLGINNFLQLSLSATSRNDSIFWYFSKLPMFDDLRSKLPGEERSLFTDLLNSFRFDNDDLRRDSPFKMKTFNLSATHHLGEWDAIFTWAMAPYRRPEATNFELDNTISFLLQWKAISEIKSDIKYNKRNDEWIVK